MKGKKLNNHKICECGFHNKLSIQQSSKCLMIVLSQKFGRDEILVQLFPFFQCRFKRNLSREEERRRVQASSGVAERGNSTFLITSADKICPNYRHLINNKFTRINLIVSTSRTRIAFYTRIEAVLQHGHQMSLLNSTTCDLSYFY